MTSHHDYDIPTGPCAEDCDGTHARRVEHRHGLGIRSHERTAATYTLTGIHDQMSHKGCERRTEHSETAWRSPV